MFIKYFETCAGKQSRSMRKALVNIIKSETYRSQFSQSNLFLSTQDLPMRNVDDNTSSSVELNKNKKNKSHKLKVAEEISNYFSQKSRADIVRSIPKKYFRRNRVPTDHLYLAHTGVADTIFSHIKDNLQEESVVVEGCPGIGFLAKKLIAAGVKKLCLHEPSPTFYKYLEHFYYLHHDKVTLHRSDIFSIWKLDFQDKMDHGSRVNDILSHFPKGKWTDEPQLKIVGHLNNLDFFKHLVLNIVFQRGLMSHCRPEMYIILPPSLHLSLTCSGEDGYRRYRNITVFFQMFFDCVLLEKLDRKAFLPWPGSAKGSRTNEFTALDKEWLYLMRIVPKADLYNTIPVDKLPAFWHFVRDNFWSRSGRVIPKMESWIPGSGARLIIKDYNIFREFGDLKPSEILDIFIQFSSWPEYQDSSFLTSMETTLLKLDENSFDNLDRREKERESDQNDQKNDDQQLST